MMRLIIVLASVVVLTACHVSNRLYNPASGLGDTPALESVVALTPNSSQPDVVDATCTPVGKACLAFLEFDDMGESWDRRQLPEAIAMIERATSLPRPPVVVVFIHGWKNNADRDERHRNGNVVGFEGILEYLRHSVYPQSPVIGIYIGWRGDLIPPYWPARRQLSYFNRENAAIRVPGPSLTTALVTVATTAHQRNPGSYVLMIGHSFGALVLERALSQAMADYALRAATDTSTTSTTRDGGWADLVTYINSAAAANEGKQMLDLLKNRTVFLTRDDTGRDYPHPLFLSVSSLGDAATRFALPVGHGPSFLVHKSTGSFRSYGAADAPQPPVTAQSAYFTSTVAHMQALQSHTVAEGTACTEDSTPLSPAVSFTLPNAKTYQLCEKSGRWNDTPYWAMQIPASIVRDHSSIFTEDFVKLMRVFLPAPEVVADPQRRPRLLAAVTPARAQAGSSITLRGLHFGTTPGSIAVASQQAMVTEWNDWSVVFALPSGLAPGQTRITLTTSDTRQTIFPLESLTVEP